MFSIARERMERPARKPRRIDPFLLAGILVAACAIGVGIASTGAGLRYFLQPAGAAIVLGGTLGILLMTTPVRMIRNSWARTVSVFSRASPELPELLIEEIVQSARIARKSGLLALEASVAKIENAFLRDGLLLSMDLGDRAELQAALETELRLRERQGEADAKALEAAGGFAPTLGILGTVVGLIDVLRHFSDFQAVGAGIGTAFVSTIYGLALANLVLLPLAQRIRISVADEFETHELILEGVLCVADGLHPSLIRQKLGPYLHETGASGSARNAHVRAEAHG